MTTKKTTRLDLTALEPLYAEPPRCAYCDCVEVAEEGDCCSEECRAEMRPPAEPHACCASEIDADASCDSRPGADCQSIRYIPADQRVSWDAAGRPAAQFRSGRLCLDCYLSGVWDGEIDAGYVVEGVLS